MTLGVGGKFAAIAAVLFVAACSSAGTRSAVCRCPQPVAYDDATIKKITTALQALPPDSILHETMDDYEDERDYLRQCLGEN